MQEAAERNAPHGPKARRAARGTSSATFSGTRYGAPLENFDLVESIDALETACSMDRVLREGGAERTFPIFIEVNMSREPAKSGVAPEEAERLLESIMKSAPSLHVEGLMTVAEDTDDEAVLRATFGGLRELRDRLAAGLRPSAARALDGHERRFRARRRRGQHDSPRRQRDIRPEKLRLNRLYIKGADEKSELLTSLDVVNQSFKKSLRGLRRGGG